MDIMKLVFARLQNHKNRTRLLLLGLVVVVGALKLWKKMLPSLLHIWTNDYFQCVMRAAHHRGFGLGNVRRPLRPISAEAEAAMLATLAPLLENAS